MARTLSILTQRAEPLAMDMLVDALKRRGFSPRIEVGGDGDLIVKDRRDARQDVGGVGLGWARPAHRDKVPAAVGRVVLSYDLALSDTVTGWDHFLFLTAALSVAELARGFVYDGEEAITATTFAERIADQGALPFAGAEAVFHWEADQGMSPAAPPVAREPMGAIAVTAPPVLVVESPLQPVVEAVAVEAAPEPAAQPAREPEPAPELEPMLAAAPAETRQHGELPVLAAGTPLAEATAQVIEALAGDGIGAVRMSAVDPGPFEILALPGDVEDLIVVAVEPWTDALQARALRRLGPLRTRNRARLRFASAEPLPERLAYLFGMDRRGDLELELLAAAREMPKLCAQSAPTLAAVGKELIARRLGANIPGTPEATLKLIDRLVLDVLRPVRERTTTLPEGAFVPECTLVVLGCVAGEVLRAHPSLEARWVDGDGPLPRIEARRRGDAAAQPARTSPVSRAFDLYTRGVAHRFEALVPRPAAPRQPPTYTRPAPRPSMRTPPAYSTPTQPGARWFEKLLGRR